ncbi:energy-coupling factor transporter transmembrane component T family protein [Aureibacillus halotolerans]|uniref:energy-coupling factor transporter transmembrane component T family protein n=1 Tax=Aureibacillus halotolerans TaxID=1508390 RepID=UPI001FB6CA1A|nr:energy-coupling factor transporter transmembrane component T [Aureibacillus halotolerans]
MNLSHYNPSVKAAVIIVAVLCLAFFFDPVTPAIVFVGTVVLTFVWGKVPLKPWLLMMSPFLFIAVGYVWTTIVFAKPSDGPVLWQMGSFAVTLDAVLRGCALSIRVLAVASLSLLFAFTTDATKLLLSLMQQCRLSPKLAYGIMAGYRFLPLFKDEWKTLQNARRVRGMGASKRGISSLFTAFQDAIPLLASAVRRAEQTAMAMESKGFTGGARTFYHEVNVTMKDSWFAGAIVLLFVLAIAISMWTGMFTLFGDL